MTATAGWPVSFQVFEPATWTGPRRADSFATEPYTYPGVRPTGSYLVEDSQVIGLDPTPAGWVTRDGGAAVDVSGRHLVVAYGSNADPEKLTAKLNGTGVFVLRCLVVHHAAVWCDARRSDSSVIATIVPDWGRAEVHHVLAVTGEQLDLIDRWEGAQAGYYERQHFAGPLVLENGEMPTEALVYVGTSAKRPPLLVEGRMLRISEHPHDEVTERVRP